VLRLFPQQELLTSIGLAFWIIDDGGISHGDLFLHTDSYTIEEVQILITVLRTKFNLDCWETLRRPGQYAIYIPSRELHKVRKLVSQFIHPFIIYNISGD
jgi:LAGLIDADG DNA endonuclease family